MLSVGTMGSQIHAPLCLACLVADVCHQSPLPCSLGATGTPPMLVPASFPSACSHCCLFPILRGLQTLSIAQAPEGQSPSLLPSLWHHCQPWVELALAHLPGSGMSSLLRQPIPSLEGFDSRGLTHELLSASTRLELLVGK